jgi:hypothetical protein
VRHERALQQRGAGQQDGHHRGFRWWNRGLGGLPHRIDESEPATHQYLVASFAVWARWTLTRIKPFGDTFH